MHLRILLRHLQGVVQVAVAGGEDHLDAGAHHALHDPLHIGIFRDVLEVDGFHVVQMLFQVQSALILSVVVAVIGFGSDVNEAHLGLGGYRETCGENGRSQ